MYHERGAELFLHAHFSAFDVTEKGGKRFMIFKLAVNFGKRVEWTGKWIFVLIPGLLVFVVVMSANRQDGPITAFVKTHSSDYYRNET